MLLNICYVLTNSYQILFLKSKECAQIKFEFVDNFNFSKWWNTAVTLAFKILFLPEIYKYINVSSVSSQSEVSMV